MQLVSWEAYDEASGNFFESYERLSFSKTHRSFLRFLPEKGGACLDVGAGSGRDASALAQRGFYVTAVEPSRGLRILAMQHHMDAHIRWIDDHLPLLSKVVALGDRYSFILLSAVWMHIPPTDRVQSLKTLTQLLEPEGCIALTLRMGEPCHNRVMYPVSVSELIEQAGQLGLKAIYVSRSIQDSMDRHQIAWKKVVLAKAGSSKWP